MFVILLFLPTSGHHDCPGGDSAVHSGRAYLVPFRNVTLNIMTFGGLALAVGRLVDDSIVELEAISRHYNERKAGQTKIQATLEAAREVASRSWFRR